MKRFTVISVLFSVSILAFWVIIDSFAAAQPEAKSDTAPIVVRNETDEMLKASQSGVLAAPLTGSDMKIAPVFDVTGAVVSDPTGTILSGINP